MIEKLPLKANNQLNLDGINFSKLPIKFSIGIDNTELSKFIFTLFGDNFYLVKSENEHIDDTRVKELMEYYEDLREHFEEEGNLFFPKHYVPNYQILCKCDHEKYNCFGYDIIKVFDVNSLNFFFSTGGDDSDISIFSSDYSVEFLSRIWFEILEYSWSHPDNSDFKFYEYLYSKYPDYIKTKKFSLIDTYGEDEDSDNYLFISSQSVPNIIEINEIVKGENWYKILSDKLNQKS